MIVKVEYKETDCYVNAEQAITSKSDQGMSEQLYQMDDAIDD